MTEEFTLEDLENMSGLTMRTLRYYIQEGLLPGPDTRGKYARYSQSHLDTIRFIERLKLLNMPLKQIRHLLETMSSEDIERIIQSEPVKDLIKSSPSFLDKEEKGKKNEEKRSSALDYIHSLESPQEKYYFKESIKNNYLPPAPAQIPAPGLATTENKQAKDGETWQRIQLADGLELQVRQPISKEKERIVNELIEISGKLLRKINQKGDM